MNRDSAPGGRRLLRTARIESRPRALRAQVEHEVQEVERELILKALARLDDRDRHLVAEGLNQRSSRGRVRYLAKLAAEAREEAVRAAAQPVRPTGGGLGRRR